MTMSIGGKPEDNLMRASAEPVNGPGLGNHAGSHRNAAARRRGPRRHPARSAGYGTGGPLTRRQQVLRAAGIPARRIPDGRRYRRTRPASEGVSWTSATWTWAISARLAAGESRAGGGEPAGNWKPRHRVGRWPGGHGSTGWCRPKPGSRSTGKASLGREFGWIKWLLLMGWTRQGWTAPGGGQALIGSRGSAAGEWPGVADGSLEGQHVCGSRLAGQAAPGACGQAPGRRQGYTWRAT